MLGIDRHPEDIIVIDLEDVFQDVWDPHFRWDAHTNTGLEHHLSEVDRSCKRLNPLHLLDTGDRLHVHANVVLRVRNLAEPQVSQKQLKRTSNHGTLKFLDAPGEVDVHLSKACTHRSILVATEVSHRDFQRCGHLAAEVINVSDRTDVGIATDVFDAGPGGWANRPEDVIVKSERGVTGDELTGLWVEVRLLLVGSLPVTHSLHCLFLTEVTDVNVEHQPTSTDVHTPDHKCVFHHTHLTPDTARRFDQGGAVHGPALLGTLLLADVLVVNEVPRLDIGLRVLVAIRGQSTVAVGANRDFIRLHELETNDTVAEVVESSDKIIPALRSVASDTFNVIFVLSLLEQTMRLLHNTRIL